MKHLMKTLQLTKPQSFCDVLREYHVKEGDILFPFSIHGDGRFLYGLTEFVHSPF